MLEELKEDLKKAYTMLDDFCRDAEIKSGEMMAKDYVKRNNLEYIESDILDAFHMGYITALRQMKDGKNQDYIIVKKKDLNLDWYKETKARLQEERK
jgi:hypothetical protein